MARKMIVMRDDGQAPMLLSETEAKNELQLQEQLKNTPDLLPVDEWEMTGPLLVIGRETQLASGAADLLAIARSGELVIVEFKTGPQNADFRRVLAQLIDYGAALWQMSYEEFQETIARPFFDSARCPHPGRFAAATATAFEARTVVKPRRPGVSGAAGSTSEERFLAGVSDDAYREALQRVLDACRRLGLRFEWGARGTSIRIQTAERAEPFSIGWLFPPGTIGWMGLTDLTLGYDSGSTEAWPHLASVFDAYVDQVRALRGATPAKPNWLRGCRLAPEVTIAESDRIVEALVDLVRRINGEV